MQRRDLMTSLLAAVAVSGCRIFADKHGYRYRLTVEIETPQGLRTGSSVIEVSAYESHGLNGSIVQSDLRGESVSIDLPNGDTLFALLQSIDGLFGAYASAAYYKVLPESITKNTDWRVFDDAIAQQTMIVDVPIANFPIFVRFTDINNPASVVLVDPQRIDRDFGPGIKLTRVYVSVTQDDVTVGISRKLIWLRNVGQLKHGDICRAQSVIECSLSRRSFSQGIFSIH